MIHDVKEDLAFNQCSIISDCTPNLGNYSFVMDLVSIGWPSPSPPFLIFAVFARRTHPTGLVYVFSTGRASVLIRNSFLSPSSLSCSAHFVVCFDDSRVDDFWCSLRLFIVVCMRAAAVMFSRGGALRYDKLLSGS